MPRRRKRITAPELARELGVPPRDLRRLLQSEFPRPSEERGRPWLLTRRQARAVRRRFRPPRRRRRILLGVAVGLLALVAGAAGIAAAAYWQAEAYVAEMQAGPKREVVEAVRQELDVPPRRPSVPVAPTPAKTILLVGSDARWDDPGNRRSDTILLVRVDPPEQRIALLSIPRDLLVEIPGFRADRVNMAYRHGGVPLLTRTLREALGVEINHFVEVDFRGFRQLVSALGGVYLPVDARYFNRNLGTPGTNFAEIDLHAGYQLLTGKQALAFARFRHTDSDLVRAARQQLFLREAGRQLVESRYNVFRLRALVRAFVEATTSDVDDVGQLWRLMRAVEETPSSRVARLTLPVEDATVGGASYVRTTREQLRRTLNAWHGADGMPVEAPRRNGAARDARAQPQAMPAPNGAGLLAPDGGRGQALARSLGPVAACAPTALPRGFWWPSRDPAHRYTLDGRPAGALWATGGSGRSVLWTMTTWKRPPILASPTETIERGGRTYELWRENGMLRQVAWQLGDVRVWITNTLTNELSAEQMLALADSCRPR